MFQLYYNRENKKIKISPLKNLMVNTDELTNEITFYNDNHFVSLDRKVLKSKAEEIKQQWIKEIEEELKQVKEIKIEIKYK